MTDNLHFFNGFIGRCAPCHLKLEYIKTNQSTLKQDTNFVKLG